MASLVWSREAEENLSAIYAYISLDNPAVASRVVDDLVEATKRLASFPLSGRLVEELKEREVREIVATPYRIAYKVSGDQVAILRVWHGKRLLRPQDF